MGDDIGGVFEGIAGAVSGITEVAGPLLGAGSFGVLGGSQVGLGALFPTTDSAVGASPRALAGINSAGAKSVSREPIPAKRWVYGRATTSGAVFFLEKAPPHIVIGYLVADGESDGLERAFVQGIEVSFDQNGFAITPPYSQDGQAGPLLQASFRNGAVDQAIDPIIAETFPNVPVNFRQRGITTVVIKADYGLNDDDHREFWGDSFDPLLRIRGRKVFDPRDRSQLRDEPQSWKWSDNSILCIADFLRADFGGRVPAELIDYGAVSEGASICDQLVGTLDGGGNDPVNGGAIKRYTANGLATGENTPLEILESLLTSARSTVYWSAGSYKVLPGAARSPVMTLTENELAGAIRYSDAQSSRELINTARTEFVALADRDYQTSTGPVVDNPDYIAEDGEVLSQTLRLPFTEGSSLVQRLAKAYLEDTRLGRSLKFPLALGVNAMRAEAGDIVRVQIDTLPFINGTYEIESVSFSADLSFVELELTEYDASIYDWDPQKDETPFVVQDIDVETTA